MNTIEIYDSKLTDVRAGCGGNSEVMRIATIIKALVAEGKNIHRYGLIENPEMFTVNKIVDEALKNESALAFPITVVDGEIKRNGTYPSNLELATWLGMTQEELVVLLMKAKMSSRSFCGGDCC
ncbi:arsenic metallochaperone ArsD family protein [Acetobacterium woodii]|nr:arsenic metallochaperone ArsD family protein [Acetobacterium woodii]